MATEAEGAARPEGDFKGWAFLELMGHRKLGGLLSDATIGGGAFIRIDVFPGDAKDAVATQFYRPAAVYCITPTTEKMARDYAKACTPAPVSRFELPQETPRRPFETMQPGVDFDEDA